MLSKIFTTVKYTLMTVNLLFLITGIIILSVGSFVYSAYVDYHIFLTQRFFSLPAFCIATGIIIFLIAALGFYGAFMENKTVNMIYAGAMVLIFVFQLSACIAGYTLKGNTIAIVTQQLTDTMDLYGTGAGKSMEVTKLWDFMQSDFECCGVNNPSEWRSHLEDNLPISCCQVPPGTVNTFSCGETVQPFQIGCGPLFGAWARGRAEVIAVAGVLLVLMQIPIAAVAFYVAYISKFHEVELKS